MTLREVRDPRVIEPLSVAWAALRVVQDALDDRRLSATEAAIILDLLWHGQLPAAFLSSPADGGFEREERF